MTMMPTPILGAILMVSLGMVAAVGISNLQVRIGCNVNPLTPTDFFYVICSNQLGFFLNLLNFDIWKNVEKYGKISINPAGYGQIGEILHGWLLSDLGL